MAYKVLIAEDDPMVAMVNEQYVCKNKDFVVCASCRNGQDALDYLDGNSVDLVILDVYMPFMDGIETLKEIRAKKIDTEVIMVTAANDAATLENTMHLGVIDYLIKPFAYERFQIALEKFISKISALKGASVLDQDSVDNIITGAKKLTAQELPKGIQETTLNKIIEYVKEKSTWISTDQIAEALEISSVTVRRYMLFLETQGKVKESTDYGTGGRPCILYKKK